MAVVLIIAVLLAVWKGGTLFGGRDSCRGMAPTHPGYTLRCASSEEVVRLVRKVDRETAAAAELYTRIVGFWADWAWWYALDSAVREFIQGYTDYGGSAGRLPNFLRAFWNCESKGDTEAISPYGHLGIGQFDPASWEKAAAKTGRWDWRNPYDQGANTAAWDRFTNDPEGQWACYEE